MMDERTVAEAIYRQYRALFQMLRNAIEQCPEELWARPLDEAAFWQQALHAISSTQMYLRDSPKDPAQRSDREQLMRDLGLTMKDWSDGEKDRLREVLQKLTEPDFHPPIVPSKQTLLAYIEETAALCTQRLAQREQFASSNPFEWTGPTVVERLIYNLRHTQHHIGRLHSILGRHGVRMKWICTA
jgi:hypothetical protein